MLKAVDYAQNSVKFGNYAYANKNGNGNEASEDGYNFRGRGLFQLTNRLRYYRLIVVGFIRVIAQKGN